MQYELFPFGDNTVLIEMGKNINEMVLQTVQSLTAFLEDSPPLWMIEYIPAFTTVTILYDVQKVTYEDVCNHLTNLFSKLLISTPVQPRIVEIPVCYGGEFGPDLDVVAQRNGLLPSEVIDIHSSSEYIVYMIGFAPGFPYIGGMPSKISVPRKSTPRLKIPAGSVGIAGMQTGVYPIESPGGWQIIGRTPLKLFSLEREQPSLLQTGDHIRFRPIPFEEYKEQEMDEE